MRKKGDFFSHGVWRIRVHGLSRTKALGIRFLRIFALVAEGFTKSQVQVGASSLTFYSLLSTVPILTFFFGVARGFLLQQVFQEWLVRSFDEQKTIVDRLAVFAKDSLAQGNEGVIMGTGLLLLIWAGVRILTHLELALNRIWEVNRGRTFARRFSDYMALFFICPIFVLVSVSLTAYFSTSLADFEGQNFFYDILALLLNLIPLLLLWMLFTFIYIFIPNIRVNFMAAFWAGLVTSIIYQVVQWGYIHFQVGVSSYNAIYGTLAALPLFLIWLYISWLIVLMGAKMTFAFQNVNAYEFMKADVHLSHYFRHILCLRITQLVVKRFDRGLPPPSSIELSNELVIPLPLVNRLAYHLMESGVLAEVRAGHLQSGGFQPAISIERLTIKDVLDMISHKGEEIPLPEGDEVEKILEYFDTEDKIRGSKANLLLKDIG